MRASLAASEAIDQEAEVKEDTPMDEGKGKKRADLDTVEKFEDREAEEKDGLKRREVLGNRTGYSQSRKRSREWAKEI